MKISSLAKYAVGVTVAAAMLAACSAGGNSGFGPSGVAPMGHESGLTPLSAQRIAALTMPRWHGGAVHTDHGKSWMTPDKKKKKSSLLYVGDWGTNDVYVFSGFPKSTKLVGTLTGFDEPYGMCVDKKGDVYVGNFGNGETIEYAHGGTSALNTYTTSGYTIGCSVDASGDVAATDFYTSTGAGEVCIWKGGKGSASCYSDSSVCYYMWTFGWDSSGDLIGVGEYSGIDECMLPKGGSSMETLSPSGITIDFPGGSSWDGKYFTLGDQEAGGTYQSGDWETTLSGTTITAVGSEIKFTDSCYSSYTDDVNPFFGGKNNIVAPSAGKATTMTGPNLWCYDNGKPTVDQWAYPAGGSPTAALTTGLTEPYGAALSVGK